MDRVLALQGLETVRFDDELLDSNTSGTCSDASGGSGASGCSISCLEVLEMDW